MDSGLEPLRFGQFPLFEGKPFSRSAVWEIGTRLVLIIPGDPTDAEHRRAVTGQDRLAATDSFYELEDLVGSPAPSAEGCQDNAPRAT